MASASRDLPRDLDRDTESRLAASGFIGQRARVHVAYRLAVRIFHGSASVIAGRSGRRRVAIAAACAVGDIATGIALSRDDRPALVPRLALDAVDTSLWSLAYPGAYDPAVLTGVPLAIEAGLRMKPVRALAVPATNLAVTAAVRHFRRRPVRPAAFIWQVLGTAGGLGLRAYGSQHLRTVFVRHQRAVDAAEQQAWLAGQNSVAMGADTVVDLLCRTTPLFSGGLRDEESSVLADWKASLAATTAGKAAYLQTTLLSWQQRRNLHPDLSAAVLFSVPEGDGAIVLTGVQPALLVAALENMDLRGRVQVRAADLTDVQAPGRAVQLIVNDIEVALPADRSERFAPLDPGPAALLITALWFLTEMLPNSADVPMTALLPQTVLAILGSVFAHRRVTQEGNDAHGSVLTILVGLEALHAVLATVTMREPLTAEGIRRYPSLDGLIGFLLLAPHYFKDVPANQRAALGLAGGVGALVGLALTPRPRHLSHWLLEMMWPVSAMLAMVGMRTALEHEADVLQAQLETANYERATASFRAGRASVLAMVAAACSASRRRFDEVSKDLADDVRAVVGHRLDDLDKRLEDLSWQNV
jgi:hypothetical protein